MPSLQTPTKQSDAQQVLAALRNQSEGGKVRRFERRHCEGRTNLSIGILVFPLNDESPDIARAFTAVTKDVSTTGIGLVTNRTIPTAEALLRLSGASETRLLRTTVRNRKELGQGWVRFDMELTGVADKNEYPQLSQFVGSVLS